MKKLLVLGLFSAVLAACASSTQEAAINAVPAKLTKAVSAADRACTADSDCVAVQKGCCMCAGYEAVNTAAAAKVQKVQEKQCANSACTREMCYVQITPKCQNNVCVGEKVLPRPIMPVPQL